MTSLTNPPAFQPDTDQLARVVYSPVPEIRSPLRLIRSMAKDLWHSRELAWRLFVRDISSQYRQSLLGILWAFLPPIVTGLLFIYLRNNDVVNIGQTDIPYPVYVLIGTSLWQLFSESINAPLKSMNTARPMLAKINFPREALIVSVFYSEVLSMLIKMVALGILFALFRYPINPLYVLMGIPAILMLILFGITVGLLLTPVGMLYTDISSSLSTILQILFFATPVIYPPPDTFPLSLLNIINPVSPLLTGARDLITKGSLSNPKLYALIAIGTFILIGFSWLIYRISLPIIIERIEA